MQSEVVVHCHGAKHQWWWGNTVGQQLPELHAGGSDRTRVGSE